MLGNWAVHAQAH